MHIDPSTIHTLDDPAAVAQAGTDLLAAARDMATKAEQGKTNWQQFRGAYKAPEQDAVWSLLDKPGSTVADLLAGADRANTALQVYALSLQVLARQRPDLVKRVEDNNELDEINSMGDPDFESAIEGIGNELTLDIDAFNRSHDAAQQECADTLAHLDQPLAPMGPDDEQDPDPETWDEALAGNLAAGGRWLWNNAGVPIANGVASMGNAAANNRAATVETMAGMLMMAFGAGMDAGGVAIAATGVGAPMGGAIVVGGTEVVLAGGALAIAGSSQLAMAAAQNPVSVASTSEQTSSLNPDKQGKHVRGHRNFDPKRSETTADADTLASGAGKGQQVGSKPVGEAGSKERVDYGQVIGIYRDPTTGQAVPTTKAIIHYGSNGSFHVVPARP